MVWAAAGIDRTASCCGRFSPSCRIAAHQPCVRRRRRTDSSGERESRLHRRFCLADVSVCPPGLPGLGSAARSSVARTSGSAGCSYVHGVTSVDFGVGDPDGSAAGRAPARVAQVEFQRTCERMGAVGLISGSRSYTSRSRSASARVSSTRLRTGLMSGSFASFRTPITSAVPRSTRRRVFACPGERS